MESSGNNNRRKGKSDTCFTRLLITEMVPQNENIDYIHNTDNTRHVKRSTDAKKMSSVGLLGKQLRLLAIYVMMKLFR